MAHIAMLVPPMHGHVNPALGTAAELAARGHRLTMHLPERFRAPVQGASAHLHPVPEPPEPAWARTDDPLVRFAGVPAVLADAARTVLPEVLTALAAEPPDVLVYDHLCVWGRLAADISGRPVVQLCTSYAAGPAWSPWRSSAFAAVPRLPAAAAAWAGAIAELAARFDTPRLEVADLLAGADRPTVVFVPRVLHPAAAAFDDRFAFVGPALRPPLPGDLAAVTALDLDDRPLAYVSMGTLFADVPELDRLCETAFADEEWQVVLTSPGEPAARRGPLRVRPTVPQLDVLDRAAVAVTHGGMGSVLEALTAGVPMVVLPRVPEQEITAERLVALGVAVRLDQQELTPAALRAAVDHVVTDARTRRAVQRVGHAVRAAGGAPAAARVVLSAVRPSVS